MRYLASLVLAAASASIAIGDAVNIPNRGSSAEYYTNPILPGFHPDPSCIFIPEHNNTFFCATSSFYAFPGFPIFASQDLANWTQISTALSRPSQLPALATTNRSTGGIWAPTLRHHGGTFYISSTLVFDDLPKNDTSRWDNFILSTTNPYASNWSDPVHFAFPAYDPSLFWDDDGTVYITGAHSWNVWPGILSTTIDLATGTLGPLHNPWNGTGGLAPEGPHIYKRNDSASSAYYYLVAAEGGTGENHMVTMARSRHVHGPYEPAPGNPLLSNANDSSAYFQAVGHVDLFHDGMGQWWAVGLSVRSGPEVESYPMGRETFLTPVVWPAEEFPVFTPVQGRMELQDGRTLPCPSCRRPGTASSQDRGQSSDLIDPQTCFVVGSDDDLFTLSSPLSSQLPPHFTHYRLPIAQNYAIISPTDPTRSNALRLTSSALNLTSYDGYFTGGQGQTFVGRRQEHTRFVFGVDFDYSGLSAMEDEAGLTLFVVQRYHFDMGVIMLPSLVETEDDDEGDDGGLAPHLRIRGMSGSDANGTVVVSLSSLLGAATQTQKVIRLQIEAVNETHFAFSAGFPVSREGDMDGDNSTGGNVEMTAISHCTGSQLTWGFTGTLLGVYATTNGREVDERNGGDGGAFDAWFSRWTYRGLEQIVE